MTTWSVYVACYLCSERTSRHVDHVDNDPEVAARAAKVEAGAKGFLELPAASERQHGLWLCPACKRDLGKALGLVELATAAEYDAEWRSDRLRAALDAAWKTVDPDRSHRAAVERERGCVTCGEPFGDGYQDGDQLCGRCAEKLPEVDDG